MENKSNGAGRDKPISRLFVSFYRVCVASRPLKQCPRFTIDLAIYANARQAWSRNARIANAYEKDRSNNATGLFRQRIEKQFVYGAQPKYFKILHRFTLVSTRRCEYFSLKVACLFKKKEERERKENVEKTELYWSTSAPHLIWKIKSSSKILTPKYIQREDK